MVASTIFPGMAYKVLAAMCSNNKFDGYRPKVCPKYPVPSAPRQIRPLHRSYTEKSTCCCHILRPSVGSILDYQ